jgi:hypothetical protein
LISTCTTPRQVHRITDLKNNGKRFSELFELFMSKHCDQYGR